jgi:hypothetical protein
VTSNPAMPPPVIFVADREQLARIQEQITAPPDPAVVHWTPPPDYNPQTVAVRIRLERSAELRESQAPPTPGSKPASRALQVTESTTGSGTVFKLSETIDFSSSQQFQTRIQVESRPTPPDSDKTFGVIQAAPAPRSQADKIRRRRFSEEDLAQRLKQKFLNRDEP